ncbi:hypothetical protein BDV98DRAFT_214707 [Pterulicium gracile]|uniref:Uncharacterized protein n=1 Tax=Pterulicium gracile TaxID=1884261 RepID=A0A5C3QAW5_9AGAR|nr:hypothetical protein BDV98DRAFT_214707 [Pterula gracilis]
MARNSCWFFQKIFTRKKEYASRTFSDNIHVLTNKFTNWEPSVKIEVGDYGKINKDTGVFSKIGNIFDDGKTKGTEELKRKTHGQDTKLSLASSNVRAVAFEAGPNIQLAPLGEIAIQSQYQCSRDYGAILLMHKPSTTKLEGSLDTLKSADFEHLLGMYLVTEVDTCPAYAMYLSAKSSEVVKFMFALSAPIAAAMPGVTAGGSLGPAWYNEGTVGVYRSGSEPNQTYTTLFQTWSLGKKKDERRDTVRPGDDISGPDVWAMSVPPWEPLDEDGKEMD